MTTALVHPLTALGLNRSMIVAQVNGAPALRRRLAALGVRPGALVTLLQRTAGGGRVVAVAGSRIALDRAVLDSIEVAHA